MNTDGTPGKKGLGRQLQHERCAGGDDGDVGVGHELGNHSFQETVQLSSHQQNTRESRFLFI